MTDDSTAAGAPPKGRNAPPANRIAEKILDERRLLTDALGQVYQYGAGYWRELTEAELQRIALEADGVFHTSARRRGEICSFIRAKTCQGVRWGRVHDCEVPCENGVVDVRDGDERPHDPDDYLERVLPWPFAAAEDCPAWRLALEQWFGPGDQYPPPEVTALQEFFGYVVLSHAKFKKALVLYGGGDTGKSVVLYVLTQLVGETNTCSLPVDHMGDPTKRAVLKAKLLNVVSEISTGALVDDGGFKQLVSTEEPILIDEKYKPTEMYIPKAKHVIACNVLPRVNDRTEATLNRLLIIPMTRVIPREEQDEGLRERLVGEMPGILNWAIEGARRLVGQRGQFSPVPAAGRVLAELRQDSNPIRLWLEERCEPERGKGLPLSVAAQDFNSWNRGNRRVTPRQLGKMLRQAEQLVGQKCLDRKTYVCLLDYKLASETPPAFVEISDAERDDALRRHAE